jgi:hypothetical protein
MPDPLLILQAMGIAAIAAMVVVLLAGLPWRATHPLPARCGAVLGMALGLFAGCWWLGLSPRWPPREDLDRFLLVLIPAAAVAEWIAAVAVRPAWLGCAVRGLVAAGAGRVLLHGSIYLEDLAGPGSRQWSVGESWTTLSVLGVMLAVVWIGLACLTRRTADRSTAMALALANVGAAVAVMLSGYATGGQPALPLASALVGVSLATLRLSNGPMLSGAIGLGVVGLFGVLAMGRYFAELQSIPAVLLLLAPLCCWIPELPYLRRLGPKLRGSLRICLTALPVAVACWLAYQGFAARSAPAAPAPGSPSIQDYMDFGKQPRRPLSSTGLTRLLSSCNRERGA